MQKIAHWLLVIGGLNWLLVGILSKDLFVLLGLDMTSWFPRLVYILVGLAAVVTLFRPRSTASPAPQM